MRVYLRRRPARRDPSLPGCFRMRPSSNPRVAGGAQTHPPWYEICRGGRHNSLPRVVRLDRSKSAPENVLGRPYEGNIATILPEVTDLLQAPPLQPALFLFLSLLSFPPC